MSTTTSAIWAFAAGAPIPMMATLNAGLACEAGGTIQATVLLFATRLIASLLFPLAPTETWVSTNTFHERVGPRNLDRRKWVLEFDHSRFSHRNGGESVSGSNRRESGIRVDVR
jgi:hypothetical protein